MQVSEAIQACQEKKAEQISVLELEQGTGAFTDYFVVCSGTNPRQIQAISDEVELRLKRAGVYPNSIEGYKQAEWVLIDYVDFVIHIFSETVARVLRSGAAVEVREKAGTCRIDRETTQESCREEGRPQAGIEPHGRGRTRHTNQVKLTIAWIGKTKNPAIQSLTDDYLKRLRQFSEAEGLPLKDEAALSETLRGPRRAPAPRPAGFPRKTALIRRSGRIPARPSGPQSPAAGIRHRPRRRLRRRLCAKR